LTSGKIGHKRKDFMNSGIWTAFLSINPVL
jgi:hypothetical protein